MKLKLLSYNIHKGFDRFNLQFVLHEIKRALQETKCDLLLLQEVVGENKEFEKKLNQWPRVSQFEFLADSFWPHYSYGKNASFPMRHHGNALLSKFPIVKEENLNISTNRFEQRGLQHCEIWLPEVQKTLHIMNVHLDLTHGGRKKQYQKILQRVQESVSKDALLILGGDFNDWNRSFPEHFKEEKISESFLAFQGYHAKTFPNFFPLFTLDRVYFRNFRVLHAEVLMLSPWNGLSDHLPLLVELEVFSGDHS